MTDQHQSEGRISGAVRLRGFNADAKWPEPPVDLDSIDSRRIPELTLPDGVVVDMTRKLVDDSVSFDKNARKVRFAWQKATLLNQICGKPWICKPAGYVASVAYALYSSPIEPQPTESQIPIYLENRRRFLEEAGLVTRK